MNGQASTMTVKPRHRSASHITLWSSPFSTVNFFLRESLFLLYKSYIWLLSHFRTTLFIISIIVTYYAFTLVEGSHSQYFTYFEKKSIWCAYWVGLGILSSVGLGTGLHTFLLYLGPHIAAVTLAAYECESLDFPEPPYPDQIVCPDDDGTGIVSIWSIMAKVRLEAFMWGAGTALGELPPYFMARAARLSGQELNDSDNEESSEEDEEEQDEKKLEEKKKKKLAKHKWYLKAKESVKTLVEKVGFFGILACASIPNPLFDLAGITCGHFLVPFWTFFGATLIGKAVIKMHIQKLFVIIAFNEHHFETFIEKIKLIPYFGKLLQEPFREFLNKQKASLHRKAATPSVQEGSWLGWVFEKFVVAMIVYFVVSIVNSMAQSYYKREVLNRSSKTPANHINHRPNVTNSTATKLKKKVHRA